MSSSDWVSLVPRRKIRVWGFVVGRGEIDESHNRPESQYRTEYGYVTHEYRHLHDHFVHGM
jgi:hypothetical protein